MIRLFVVGFPRNMAETALLELFSLHGAVEMITIVTDQGTRQSKGYGFVHMADEPAAERAVRELDGMMIGERVLSVRFAEDKQDKVVKKTGGEETEALLKTTISGDQDDPIQVGLPKGAIKKKRPRISRR